MDDLDLVRQFQAGSERAFNELVLKHRRGVYLTAVGLLGNPDDADDITQDVFLKVYGSIGTFRGDSAVYTWIYRICVNLCLNAIRKRKTRSFIGLESLAAATPEAERADADLEISELNEHARRAIASLPEKQRAVFLLRHFRGLPHAEIARIMDRDEGTIKANYFQAIKKLKARLGPYFRDQE